jgi:predicted nucleic acid-binding protein
MINTVSLDTSVLVRILTKDKPEDCRKALNFLNQGLEFIVEDIALSETIYVLETIYDKSREEIIDLVNFFLTRYADKIEYNHELTSLVFPFYLTHPKISFNDCYLASCAEIKGAEPLMTFDKKLASQHPSAKLLA